MGSMLPDAVRAAMDHAQAELERISFVDALWSRRLDVWSDRDEVRRIVAKRLGWLDAPGVVEPWLPRVGALAGRVREAGFTGVVLLGMGGASLAPEVLHRTLAPGAVAPRFRMLDSVDPDAVARAMSHAATTLFVVASKSGSTIEPRTLALEARRRVEAAGHHPWGSCFLAITDEGTELHRLATAERFFDVFVNPSDIGGRFSALSLFGLVPAALLGIPLPPLLARTHAMIHACQDPDTRTNPGVELGAFLAACAHEGRDKLTLLVPPALASFGLWVEQLVAESTGKQGRGIVPIVGEPVRSVYGPDRAVVTIAAPGQEPDHDHTERLQAAGAPVFPLTMPALDALGAEFFRWEVATATAARLLGVNPFDEPNVRQAKEATSALLATCASAGALPEVPSDHVVGGARVTLSGAAHQALGDTGTVHLSTAANPGDYVALLAYLPPDDAALAEALADVRAYVGARTQAATVAGFGPRYLHSTGQLFKGGPPTGVFLIVTATPDDDLQVPGAPYTFGTLEMAQAIGDFTSLDAAGRRAVLVRVSSRRPDELRRVLRQICG